MNVTELLSSIDAEIARLREVRNLLAGEDGRGPSPGRKPAKRHTMSAEGRAKIAAAQRARWAKQKRAAKAA